MQPFVARLAALELSAASKNKMAAEPLTRQTNHVHEDERPCPTTGQAALDRPQPMEVQPAPEGAWVQTTNRRRQGNTGKTNQANLTLQQVNLTPRSYVVAAAVAEVTSTAPNQLPTQNQFAQLANPPPAFTEVTVVRLGGSLIDERERATRARQPDAIVREVRANMARAVAKPLPIITGRWSSGA
jgi:hypothetical protein